MLHKECKKYNDWIIRNSITFFSKYYLELRSNHSVIHLFNLKCYTGIRKWENDLFLYKQKYS